MNIVDLDTPHHATYFKCLEDSSAEMAEAGNHKACWFHKYKDRGLRVKLAVDDTDRVVGFIQYLPVEESIIDGRDLYFILCVWVHGYPEGVGDQQGQGIGTQLLAAAEADARELGAKGMAAWGMWLPFWMKASWFRKHGYQKADRLGISLLVWKAFEQDAQPPLWIHQKKSPPVRDGKVSVAAFKNGWCPAQNVVFERTRRACAALGDQVVFEEYDTSEKAVFQEWGISDGVFIDGKKIYTGPPPPYEKLFDKIQKKVRRLNKKEVNKSGEHA